MTQRALMNLSAFLVLAAGCGSKQSPPSTPPAEAAHQPPMCSMMKDAQLTAADGPHDVTITFTTQGDPTELRAHVRKMGAMHDRMAHGMGRGMTGGGGTGSDGSGGMMGDSGMMGGSGTMGGSGMHEHMAMVPSHAAVDDVEHGARIVLTPDDSAKLAALRDQVHEHVEMMKSGRCSMMEDHGAQPGDQTHDAHHNM